MYIWGKDELMIILYNQFILPIVIQIIQRFILFLVESFYEKKGLTPNKLQPERLYFKMIAKSALNHHWKIAIDHTLAVISWAVFVENLHFLQNNLNAQLRMTIY